MSSYFDNDFVGINAPTLPTNITLLNSPPLTMAQLHGKVILIDFWTYSCINCQRTLPYLKNWWNKYKDHGFVLIGVHTPEFEFEKNIVNVKNALKKYHVTWPVVIDNDYQIWESYSNHYWPAKYLVNKNGKIIYTHFGEGNYIESEIEIQKALKDAGYRISESMSGQQEWETTSLGQTPEIYCGYQRGKLGNKENFKADEPHLYNLDAGNIKPDLVYLQGSWKATGEYVEHARSTKELEDLITLSYRAKKVHLVMEAANYKAIKVYLTLDGVGLNSDSAGADVQFDDKKRAYIEVTFPTLYHLIDTSTFGDHILRLSTLDEGLRCYTFTFGG